MSELLLEMATLTRLEEGFGFIYVIHTNDHEPAHIHLYLNQEDIRTENYYTRVCIPEECPKTINDVKVCDNDRELTNIEKKIVLKWFLSPSKRFPEINNFVRAYLQWETYQNR